MPIDMAVPRRQHSVNDWTHAGHYLSVADVPMQEPRARVVGEESDNDARASNTDNVSARRINVVERA